MAKFEEEKVINALHPEKAEVGKRYWFADNIVWLKRKVVNNEPYSILKNFESPCFEVVENKYFLLYPYEEPPKQSMTYRQLAEWLAKGNGEYIESKDKCSVCMFSIGYTNEREDKSVRQGILIRSWGSDDWIEPTVDIYERDCKGGK